MQIVIDIPESRYRLLKTQARTNLGREKLDEFAEAVLNGTPLPKGHGRLIDEREVYKKFYFRCLAGVAKEVLDETSPIIEADKESEDKE